METSTRSLAFIRRIFERYHGLEPDGSHEDPANLTPVALSLDAPLALIKKKAAVLYTMQIACELARKKHGSLDADDEELFIDFMESVDATSNATVLEDIVRLFVREMEWRLL